MTAMPDLYDNSLQCRIALDSALLPRCLPAESVSC
jgi:hypothetical protein